MQADVAREGGGVTCLHSSCDQQKAYFVLSAGGLADGDPDTGRCNYVASKLDHDVRMAPLSR